jgi:hypothetical protein
LIAAICDGSCRYLPFACERLREQRAPGVAVPERDELLISRGHLRERHGGLVGLGAARREERLRDLAGRELHELLGELHDPHRRVERGDVPEPVDLRLHGRVHARVSLTEADRQNAAEEVEVLGAVEVLHTKALALVEHDGLVVVVSHAREEELFVLLPDLGRCLLRHVPLAPPIFSK